MALANGGSAERGASSSVPSITSVAASRRQRPATALRLAPALLAGAVGLAVLQWPGPVAAQAPQAAEQPFDIDIPAQPLGQALAALSRQTGLQVFAAGALVSGRTAPAVKGRLAAREALTRVLAGSGLTAVTEGASLVVRASAPADSVSPPPAATLQTVTVSGYRGSPQSATVLSSRPVLDTPFSINSLGAELLVDQQAISFTDVVRNDPSVVLAFPQFDDTINLRGFYQNQLFREGLPTNAQVRAAFQNKERFDVFKGPAGFRFGFNSPGGVVNLVVKRPTEEPQAVALFGADDHGTAYSQLDVGGRFGERKQFGLRFNGFVHDVQTFRLNGDGKQKLVSLIGDWRVTDDLTLEAEVERFNNVGNVFGLNYNASFGGDPVRARALLPRIEPEMVGGQDWMVEDRYQQVVRLRADYRLNSDWRAAVSGHRVRGDTPYGGGDITDLQPDGTYTQALAYTRSFTIDYDAVAVSIEGRAEVLGLHNDIALGHVYRDEMRVGVDSNFFTDVSTYLGGTQRGNLFSGATIPGFLPPLGTPGGSDFAFGEKLSSTYFNNTLHLGEHWQLLFGLNHARLTSVSTFGAVPYDDSATSPVLGAVFKPTAKSSIYTSYATGLEQGQTPPVTPGNPTPQPLPPIETKAYELGYKQEFGRGALFTLAAFRIDKGLAYSNDAGAFVQDGIQRHQGVEATIVGNVSRDLRLAGGLTYLDAKVVEAAENVGKTLPGIGKLRYSLFADWRTPWVKGLYLTGGVQGDTKKFVTFANDYSVPGYVIFDTGLRYELDVGDKLATFRLGVQNLADKTYFENVDFYSGLNFGQVRTVRASLELRF